MMRSFSRKQEILLWGIASVLVMSIGLFVLGMREVGLMGIGLVAALSSVLALEFRRRFAVLVRVVRGIAADVRSVRDELNVARSTASSATARPAALPPTNGVASPLPSVSGRASHSILVASRAFDSEYYAAQVGRTFATEREAVDHFLRYGMPAGMSLHPLVELTYLPSGIRQAYFAANIEAVLKHLTGANSRAHLWSPVFDPKVLDTEQHGGTLLLDRFTPQNDERVPYPVKATGEEPLRWPEFREAMLVHARAVSAIQAARKEYRRSHWDATVEREWIAAQVRGGEPDESGDTVVSIIMPAWNRAGVIRRAIESVQGQSFAAWELIVVDDGSTDGTQDVVNEVAALDNRVRLVPMHHAGVSAARNKGIAVAEGRYLAFLDSDNTWRPNFLELMVAGLDRSGGRAAYSATHLHGASREEYTGQAVDLLQMLIRNYVDLNVLVAETLLVREVGGFDTSLRRWVDYDLALKLLEETEILYFPFIGCDYVDDDNNDRITRRESQNWIHAAAEKAVVRWAAPPEEPAVSDTAVVILVGKDVLDTIATVRSLVMDNQQSPRDVVVVDDLENMRDSLKLRSHLAALGAIRVVKLPRSSTPAVRARVARRHVRSSALVFVRAGVELRSGAVTALIGKLADRNVAAAQPLVTDKNGVVLSAGLVASETDGVIVELARGLTIDDAQQLQVTAVDALAPSVFAVRTDAYDEVGGVRSIFIGDAAFIDLHWALRKAGHSLEVCSDALAVLRQADVSQTSIALDEGDVEWLAATDVESGVDTDVLYRRIGLSLSGLESGARGTLEAPFPVYRRAGRTKVSHRLRWAVKIGAAFTPGGDKWGDVPFAANLADALRSHGHDAVVDRVGAFARPTNYLEEVVLVIRGAEPCRPQPGKINAIWVISRPDRVTRQELASFDLVFVASRLWCEYLRAEWGIDAVFLPQATNPAHFHPRRGGEFDGEIDVLFVGGPRPPIGRRIVADCTSLGYDVKVVGPGWGAYVPQRMVLAESIPNDKVAALYASSRIVLNDHWADMARLGFVNNRLYDIVACGARAVSDEVDSIAELFSEAVGTYSTLEELDALLRKDDQKHGEEQLMRIGERVRLEHSFEARARTMIAHAMEHVRG